MQLLQCHKWVHFRGRTRGVCSWDSALGNSRAANVWHKEHLPHLTGKVITQQEFPQAVTAEQLLFPVRNEWSVTHQEWLIDGWIPSLPCLSCQDLHFWLRAGEGSRSRRKAAAGAEGLSVGVGEGGGEVGLVFWGGTRGQWALDPSCSASAAASCAAALCAWGCAGPCVCTGMLAALQWVLCSYRSQFPGEKVPTLREAVVESMHHNLTIYFDVKGHATQVLLTAAWHLPSALLWVSDLLFVGLRLVPSLAWASPGLLLVSPKVVLGSCSSKLAQGLCKCCTELTALLGNRAKGTPCSAGGSQDLILSLQRGVCNLHY